MTPAVFSDVAVLLADWKHYAFGPALFLTSVFLILLVLVQRGRGGGLTGALGGMGGQSAFGTKAGDLFTRVTIVSAAAWILLCIAAIKVLAPPISSSGANDMGNSILGTPDPSAEDEQDGSAADDAQGTGATGDGLPGLIDGSGATIPVTNGQSAGAGISSEITESTSGSSSFDTNDANSTKKKGDDDGNGEEINP